MKKLKMLALFCASLGLLMAAPSTTSNKTTKTAAKATAMKATTKAPAAKAAMRTAWPPETLSGKIDEVVPGSHEVVVKDASGVPFDLVVTHGTRIMNGDQAITLKDLQQDQNMSVSVRFVPESRGDIARSIKLNG